MNFQDYIEKLSNKNDYKTVFESLSDTPENGIDEILLSTKLYTYLFDDKNRTDLYFDYDHIVADCLNIIKETEQPDDSKLITLEQFKWIHQYFYHYFNHCSKISLSEHIKDITITKEQYQSIYNNDNEIDFDKMVDKDVLHNDVLSCDLFLHWMTRKALGLNIFEQEEVVHEEIIKEQEVEEEQELEDEEVNKLEQDIDPLMDEKIEQLNNDDNEEEVTDIDSETEAIAAKKDDATVDREITEHFNTLENQEKLNNAAIIIQTQYRKYNAKRNNAALKIQQQFRRYSSLKKEQNIAENDNNPVQNLSLNLANNNNDDIDGRYTKLVYNLITERSVTAESSRQAFAVKYAISKQDGTITSDEVSHGILDLLDAKQVQQLNINIYDLVTLSFDVIKNLSNSKRKSSSTSSLLGINIFQIRNIFIFIRLYMRLLDILEEIRQVDINFHLDIAITFNDFQLMISSLEQMLDTAFPNPKTSFEQIDTANEQMIYIDTLAEWLIANFSNIILSKKELKPIQQSSATTTTQHFHTKRVHIDEDIHDVIGYFKKSLLSLYKQYVSTNLLDENDDSMSYKQWKLFCIDYQLDSYIDLYKDKVKLKKICLFHDFCYLLMDISSLKSLSNTATGLLSLIQADHLFIFLESYLKLKFIRSNEKFYITRKMDYRFNVNDLDHDVKNYIYNPNHHPNKGLSSIHYDLKQPKINVSYHTIIPPPLATSGYSQSFKHQQDYKRVTHQKMNQKTNQYSPIYQKTNHEKKKKNFLLVTKKKKIKKKKKKKKY